MNLKKKKKSFSVYKIKLVTHLYITGKAAYIKVFIMMLSITAERETWFDIDHPVPTD